MNINDIYLHRFIATKPTTSVDTFADLWHRLRSKAHRIECDQLRNIEYNVGFTFFLPTCKMLSDSISFNIPYWSQGMGNLIGRCTHFELSDYFSFHTNSIPISHLYYSGSGILRMDLINDRSLYYKYLSIMIKKFFVLIIL